MLCAVRPFFFTVSECAQPFEAGLAAELEQFPELFLSLSGMPDYHSGAKDDSGDLRTQARNQFTRPGAVHMSSHIGKDYIRNMLERDVEILADFRI